MTWFIFVYGMLVRSRMTDRRTRVIAHISCV